MVFLSKYRIPFSIAVVILVLLVGVGAIFWARGFKPDFKNRKIDRTGLLIVTSVPTGAQVLLDNRLTSATDTTIAYLDPKTYKVRIQKDGFSTWEKDIEIRADLSTEIKALLFPTAPEIKPLTATGAVNPVLSPDGTKIVYATPGERGGVLVLPMSDRPFPFRQDARLIAKNLPGFDFTKSKFLWSPDSKQLIARFEDEKEAATANFLMDSDKSEQELRDITATLTSTLSTWQQDLNTKAQTLATIAPDSVKNATAEAKTKAPGEAAVVVDLKASPSPSPNLDWPNQSTLVNYYPTGMIFSPDEDKILYKDKEGKFKVFDLKTKRESSFPDFADFINISWYPDSNHLVVTQKGQVSIIETDGNNKMTVFSGKFEDGFVFAHPSGLRIIILTSLTQQEGTLPNLYAVNLR